jgi:hypothetical protein
LYGEKNGKETGSMSYIAATDANKKNNYFSDSIHSFI